MSASNNPLASYFHHNQKNIIHKWDHYFEVYHQYFDRFRNKPCTLLEIGVSMGGSLQMWKHYFGPNAKIYGIDINPACKKFEDEQIEIFIGSQSDKDFLENVATQIGPIDIVIDDGGHEMEQQIISFQCLFEHIGNNGIYLCEDTHTSYMKNYKGGLLKPDTFIEFAKNLIDHVNGWHIENNINYPSHYTNCIHSIMFFDSIVLIEKKYRNAPWHEKHGSLYPIILPDQDRIMETLFKLKLQLLGQEIPNETDLTLLIYNQTKLEELLGFRYDGRKWPTQGETMIGYKRLTNIEYCIHQTIENQIDGDLIETGVWKGGTCIYMRALLNILNNEDKKVWVADSFEGLPMPNAAIYPADKNDKLFQYEELKIGIDDVRANFKKYNLLDDRVVFLKGWFKDTMPNANIDKISVLRLDGDMYESTIDVLFYLYPKLSAGGFCIIDDWGAIPACKKAVLHYRAIFAIDETIEQIDWTGIFWKKEKDIKCISRLEFNKAIQQLNEQA